MSESYRGIQAEKRDGDKSYFAKYNKFANSDGQREFFMTKASEGKKGPDQKSKTETGKSADKKDWEVKKYKDGENTFSGDEPYKTHTPKSIFKEFDIDTGKFGGRARTRKRSKSRKSKKGGSKKRSRKVSKKRTSRKRRSTKKGGKCAAASGGRRRTRKCSKKRSAKKTSKKRTRRSRKGGC